MQSFHDYMIFLCIWTHYFTDKYIRHQATMSQDYAITFISNKGVWMCKWFKSIVFEWNTPNKNVHTTFMALFILEMLYSDIEIHNEIPDGSIHKCSLCRTVSFLVFWKFIAV